MDSDQTILEVISVFISNTYYNVLYDKSINYYNNNKFKTVKLAYEHVIKSFDNNIKNKNDNTYYKSIYNALYENYCEIINNIIKFSKFDDIIFKILLSETLNDKENYGNKKNHVMNILIKSIHNFTFYILSNEINNAINENYRHNDKGQLINRKWADIFKKILNKEIKQYNLQSHSYDQGIQFNEMNNLNNLDMINNIKLQLKKILIEKNTLINDRNLLISHVQTLINDNNKLNIENKKLKKKITKYENPNNFTLIDPKLYNNINKNNIDNNNIDNNNIDNNNIDNNNINNIDKTNNIDIDNKIILDMNELKQYDDNQQNNSINNDSTSNNSKNDSENDSENDSDDDEYSYSYSNESC